MKEIGYCKDCRWWELKRGCMCDRCGDERNDIKSYELYRKTGEGGSADEFAEKIGDDEACVDLCPDCLGDILSFMHNPWGWTEND